MRKMMIFLLLGLFFLPSCGTEVKHLGKTDQNKQKDQGPCPSVVPEPYYEIDASFASKTPPVHLSLELNGVEKFNECRPVADRQPPVVTVKRQSGNTLAVVVQQLGNGNLPAAASFKVYDLGNCAGAPAVFQEVDNFPLQFHEYYPYGQSCGKQYFAQESILIP